MLILPIISIILVYLDVSIVLEQEIKKRNGRVLALLYSLLLNTLIVLTSNEILSVFHAINGLSLGIIWGIVDCIALGVLLGLKKRKSLKAKGVLALLRFPKISSPIRGFIVILCVIVVYMAARTVPYNWDSMTYHLTRIIHWVQNGSVAHYACYDYSQISGPPLAEFVNLHVYILSGNSDIFVNLLQAFSYIMSIILVYEISMQLGCREHFSELAMVLFASSPIVFGEALSTQVDAYAGLWLLVFVYFALPFTDKKQKLQCDKRTVASLLAMGSSIGFAYLAKPSGCIAIAVFLIWLIWACIRRKDKASKVFWAIGIAGGAACVTVFPELLRNLITFHSISNEETSTGFLVNSWDIRYLLVNLAQNIGYNLPIKYLNIGALVNKAIYKFAYILYAGSEVPESLLNFAMADPVDKNHDFAVNPVIFYLLIFAVILGCIVWVYRRRKRAHEYPVCWGYIIASLSSFLIFGMVVRWYRYITRYEVGYIALLAPAVAALLSYALENRKQLCSLMMAAIVFLCASECSDLIMYHKAFLQRGDNRMTIYFSAYRDLQDEYEETAEEIISKGYKTVGFICGNDSYEYPLWKMLEGTVTRFEHVGVENETSIYDKGDFEPDCIVMVDTEGEDMVRYGDVTYILNSDREGVRLYEKMDGQ